jgi:hypothetical protein
MAKVLLFRGVGAKGWKEIRESQKGVLGKGVYFYADSEKTPKPYASAGSARAYAGVGGGVIVAEVDEEDIHFGKGYEEGYPYARAVTVPADRVKEVARIPTSDTFGTTKEFLQLVQERVKDIPLMQDRIEALRAIMQPLSRSFDRAITKEMGTEIIKDFWRGDVAAQKENLQKFGSEEIKIGAPDSDLVKGMMLLKLDPISEWNNGLFNHIADGLEKSILEGMSPSQLADVIRTRTPEILNTETVTIQHEGKRPVTMTTAHYTELLARTLPFTVRNAGYVSRMKQFPDMYEGWKSIYPDDERSCEECVERMKESEEHPYSWEDELPPYHPFCRCRPLAVSIETPPGPEPEGPEPEGPEPEPEEEFTFLPEYNTVKTISNLEKHKLLFKPTAQIENGKYYLPANDIREKRGDNFMYKRADYTYWYYKDLQWTSPGSKTLQTPPREFKGGIYVNNYSHNKPDVALFDNAHVVAALSQKFQWDYFGELLPVAGEKMVLSGKEWEGALKGVLKSQAISLEQRSKFYDELNFATISTRFWEDGQGLDTWGRLSKDIYNANEKDIEAARKFYNTSSGNARDRLLGEAGEFAQRFKDMGYYTKHDEKTGDRVTYIDDILAGKATRLTTYRALNDAEWNYQKQQGGSAMMRFTEAKDAVMADVVKAYGSKDMDKVTRISNTILAEWRHSIEASSGGSNLDYMKKGGDMSDMFNRTIMFNYLSPELGQDNTPGLRFAIFSSMKDGAMSGEEAAPLRAMFSAPKPKEATEIENLNQIIKGKPKRSILNEFPNRPSTIADIFNIGSDPSNFIMDFKPSPGKPLFEFASLSGAYGDCNNSGNHIRVSDKLINQAQGRHTAVHEYGHLTSYNLPIIEQRSVYQGYAGGLMRRFEPPYGVDAFTKTWLTTLDDEALKGGAFRERWESIREYKTVQAQMELLNSVGPYPAIIKVSDERIAELQEIRHNIDDFLLKDKIEMSGGSNFHHGDLMLYGVLPMSAAKQAEQTSGDAYKLIKGLQDGKPRNVSSGLKAHPSYVENDNFLIGSTDRSAWDNAPEGSVLVKFALKGAHAAPINEKEWIVGRSHSLMFREAKAAGKMEPGYLSKEEEASLKGRAYASVWVDPPAPEERAIVRRGSYIDHYGEKPGYDKLAQNFGVTPTQAQSWFDNELANVGKMVRLSVVIDKETDGEIGAFDEVLAVTDKWKDTLDSGRWPVTAAVGSWNPDPTQNDMLYNKVLKLPKPQIKAVLEALMDQGAINDSLNPVGRMKITETRLKELDAITSQLDTAISKVKTSADMTFFTRFGYVEDYMSKGAVLPKFGFVFGQTNIEKLITPEEQLFREAGKRIDVKAATAFAEIRVPKGYNALGIGKGTVVMSKNVELEYVRSYDHMSGVRVAIFQPKGATTDVGGISKTVPEQIEKELSDLTATHPQLAAMHQAKYAITAKYSPGAGQPEIGLTDFKDKFSKDFPPGYDPDKKEDILNYYLKNWVDRAGDNLYSASKEWQTSAEERWAMFVQGIYMDASQVEKLAPEPYAAFMKKLDAGDYGPGLSKVLGRPEKIGLSDEKIGIADRAEVEKSLTKTWNIFKKEYTPDQVEKIATWRSEFYQKINGVHRGTEGVTLAEFNKVKETTDLLDSAMHEIGLQGDVKGYVVAYRGFTHPELLQKWDKLQGSVLENSGYTPVSLDEGIAAKYALKKGSDGIIAELRIDPAVHGLYMDAVVGPERGEKEILLRRDIRSRIVRNWIDETGQKRMILEVSGR